MSFVYLLGLRFLMPTPNARKEETITQQILWDFLKVWWSLACEREEGRRIRCVSPFLLPLPISRVCRYNYGISGRRFPDFFFRWKKRPLFLREAIGGGGGRMIRKISTDTKLHFWLQMHDFFKQKKLRNRRVFQFVNCNCIWLEYFFLPNHY